MIRRPSAVRFATIDDLEPLYWMLMRDLSTDNPFLFPHTPTKVFNLVKLCCEGNGGVAGVIEERGKIIGSAGVVIAEHELCDVNLLKQVWMFVDPKARKGHPEYQDRLFRFCLWHKGDMSTRLGYDVPLEISVLSRKRLSAKLRLWGRYGEMVGGVFLARDRNEQHDEIVIDRVKGPEPRTSGGIQWDSEPGR